MTDLAAPPASRPDPVAPSPVVADGYRPHLDGLRAVAVYLVVAFHAGLGAVTGGFIGVDVFFVLSGYLVTRMLLKDLDGGGTVAFRRFYARRFRRLLPASAIALLVTALAYSAVAGPGEAAGALRSFQASYLYVANWYFIHEATGYFGAEVAANPVLHVWSLAVEEQFYLAWPLLLAGLFALARRGRGRPVATVRIVVSLAALASLAWALALQGPHPDRAYYGTDTRAYQLLAGALLALAPGAIVRLRRVGTGAVAAGIAAVAGIVVLATSLVSVGAITRGTLVTVCTVAVLAALEAAPRGPLHAVLATAPMVYLGRISYGTYLWHWPVIVIALIVGDPGPIGLAALAILLATGLASLSYQVIEMPVRRSARLDAVPYVVVGVGLAISLVAAAVIMPAILDRRSTPSAGSTAAEPVEGFTPVPEGLDLEAVSAARFGESVDCSDGAPEDCTVVRGSGPHVLLMGDSNAEMMVPAFTAMAEAEDLTLSLAVTEGCPWQRGLAVGQDRVKAACAENKEDAYSRVIPALDPDVIVAVNTEYSPQLVGPKKIRDATTASLRQLRRPGRTVALVEPMVQGPKDDQPLSCLAKASFTEDCRFVASTEPSPIDAFYRAVAARDPQVRSVDVDTLACPYLPICDPIIGGQVVRWDFQHLAAGYASTLGDELAAVLRDAGALPA